MTREDVLELIANYELTRELEENVEGLPGLADHYHRIQSLEDRRLIRKWEAAKAQARADLTDATSDDS
jgi:hypothetical protein